MNIWLDIDNSKHIPFLKSLITELKQRGHAVTVTAENNKSIKQALGEHNLNAKVTGFTFSVFGLFEEQSYLFRTALVSDYIKKRNINIAFSLGSIPMLYECSSSNMPIILFIENTSEKIHQFYQVLEKCFLLISETIPEQLLVDKGFEVNKIIHYKGNIKKDDLNPDPKAIKEIADKIEFLCKHVPGGVTA